MQTQKTLVPILNHFLFSSTPIGYFSQRLLQSFSVGRQRVYVLFIHLKALWQAPYGECSVIGLQMLLVGSTLKVLKHPRNQFFRFELGVQFSFPFFLFQTHDVVHPAPLHLCFAGCGFQKQQQLAYLHIHPFPWVCHYFASTVKHG